MKKNTKKIGEILLEEGMIDQFQLNSALSYQREWGGKLGSVIVRKGFVPEKELMAVLERQLGLRCIAIDDFSPPTPEVISLIKADMAKKFHVFPIALEGRTLMLAVSEPPDLQMMDDISFACHARVRPMLALESDIERAIKKHYDGVDYDNDPRHRGQKPQVTFREMNFEDAASNKISVKPTLSQSQPPKKGPAEPASGADLFHRTVLESVVDLLVAKGIFTKEELLRQIKAKKK